MNQLNAIISKFQSALPAIRQWIDELLENNKDKEILLATLGFQRLKIIFSNDLLEKTKVVTVSNKVPFPPLSQIGLHELASMEQMELAGITFKDTFFVNQEHCTESLHFHELIHVIQWERLGVDNFLLAYGLGLMQFGYQNSPLEQMAYSLQGNFENGANANNIVELVQKQTDSIWSQVEPLLNQS
jgi:hypothetical protein